MTTTGNKERIAFVGVGRMGANMARRLKDCGYDVTAVNDVNHQQAADLAKEIGATHCTRLQDVTAAADIIFTVIPNDAAMRSIFMNADDNLLIGSAGKTFINCATVSAAIQKEVADAAKTAGAVNRFPVRPACVCAIATQLARSGLFLPGGQVASRPRTWRAPTLAAPGWNK